MKTGKRILICGIAARRGGAETFLVGLWPELVRVAPEMQFELLVAEDRAHLYSNLRENARVVSIDSSVIKSVPRRLWFEHKRLPVMLARGGYSAYLRADEVLSPFTRMACVPTAIVFHATQHLLIPEEMADGGLRLWYLKRAKRKSIRMASAVVAVSFHERAELCGLFPFATEKISVIYHGMDQSLFKPGAGPIPKALVDRGVKKYFLCVSDRHKHKNYFGLIRAFSNYAKNNSTFEHLVIIGRPKSDEEEQRLRGAIEEVGLCDRIHVMNYVENRLLPAYYQRAMGFVFPSLFETFGLTLLEAMACGVPVACARYSAMPEICGDAAEYFDPYKSEDIARAMNVIATDEKRRRTLIEIGLQRIAHFTWKRAAEQYRDLLLDLVAGKKKA